MSIEIQLDFHLDSTEIPLEIQGDSTCIMVELQFVSREKLNLGLKDGWVEKDIQKIIMIHE